MSARGVRRATKDADANAVNVDVTVDHLTKVVRDISDVSVDDGVVFDVDTISVQDIREQAEYPGLRVRIPASIGIWNGLAVGRIRRRADRAPPRQVTIDWILGNPKSSWVMRLLQVRDVVAMGRAPYKRMFQGDSASDERIIADVLALVDATHLADRSFALMSGGGRQRVLVARALAQQPRLLVMDEPTNHLDVRHQFDVLALPAKLGVTAVIAVHDLNLAAHYCDEIYVLRAGALVCGGPPETVLTSAVMAQVWGVTATVQPHPETGKPHVNYNPAVPATDRGAAQRQ